MLLVGLVLALATGLLAGPGHTDTGRSPATAPGILSWAQSPEDVQSPAVAPLPANAPSPANASAPAKAQPSAKAQPAPADRGSANLRNAASGQPLAETTRAFGSSSLTTDAAPSSEHPLFLSRAWATRSPGALRPVLDTVAPRLGRAPPPPRVS